MVRELLYRGGGGQEGGEKREGGPSEPCVTEAAQMRTYLQQPQSISLTIPQFLNLVPVKGLEVTETKLSDRLQRVASPTQEAERAGMIERRGQLNLPHGFSHGLLYCLNHVLPCAPSHRGQLRVHLDRTLCAKRMALVHLGISTSPKEFSSLYAFRTNLHQPPNTDLGLAGCEGSCRWESCGCGW